MGGYGGGYYGPGMMGGWSGGGFFPFHGLFGLLILALVIGLVVWIVRAIMVRRDTVAPSERRGGGIDILDERYARGEINRDEYLRKRADVAG